MLGNSQRQLSGANSTNMQAQTIVNVGMTYSEVRDIALSVFKNNFMSLSAEAFETAHQRVENWTDRFLQRLEKEHPVALNSARDPGVLRALYSAQQAVACRDEEHLSEILIKIMIDRTTHTTFSIEQVMLNEALIVAPKLATEHFAVLSLIFYLTLCEEGRDSLYFPEETLRTSVQSSLEFLGEIDVKQIDIKHLMYAGCISLTPLSLNSGEAFLRRYDGLFSHGLNRHAIIDETFDAYVPHPSNDGTYILPITYSTDLQQYLAEKNLSDYHDKVLGLMSGSRLSEDQVRDFIVKGNSQTAQLFNAWDSTQLGRANLTSVGMALAHANTQINGMQSALNTWIK